MRKVFLNAQHAISCLGFTEEEHRSALDENRSGIQLVNYPWGEYYVGAIDEQRLKEEKLQHGLPSDLSKLESSACLSISSVLKQTKAKIDERDVLFLSSTKGNIDQLNLSNGIKDDSGALLQSAARIKDHFGWPRDPVLVCNACTSGLMAIIMAARMIRHGHIERAVVCGVDVLSEFVLRGFEALHAMDNKPCQPFDANRGGINLGEAGATVFLSSQPSTDSIEILGGGTSNDANHISGPSRTGQGLLESIQSALRESNEAFPDYINAHGTATLYNDEMEAKAFNRAGLVDVPVNSMKGYWGHTLGAAGVIEVIGTVMSLRNQTLYTSKGYQKHGVTEPISIIERNLKTSITYGLKTSSGFGGSNAALLMKYER